MCLTQPCANELHFGVNPDFKSPQGMAILSVYLCATREQDGDLQRCMVKYQMVLLFGVYFSYLKPEERSDPCIIYCELKEIRQTCVMGIELSKTCYWPNSFPGGANSFTIIWSPFSPTLNS